MRDVRCRATRARRTAGKIPQAADLSQLTLPLRLQGKLTAAIPNWEDLAKVLELIGAETYAFTPEGEVVLQ